jgi:Ca2+-binding RTX toxin-like protein
MATQLKTGTAAADQIAGSAGDDLIYGFDPEQVSDSVTAIAATRIQSGLSSPLYATAAPGDPHRLFVVEKGGVIKAIDLGTGQSSVFLDISTEVATGGEMGLLGLAFSPNFLADRKFYVFLSNTGGDTEIREYQVSAADPDIVDPASERLVLRVDLPDTTSNHRAGWLGFGPDGMLYIPLGDGGGAPGTRPQDPDNLLGKVLRIDVSGDDFPADANKNYSIPEDNPFAGNDGVFDEIWAFGLRNPFRDSFDRGLGTFFIADVGQNEWEEIDLGIAGANYGWPLFEGPEARSTASPDGFTFPIHSYDHSVGQTVIGGYVYRGQSEGLHGQFFFADFIAGKVFTLAEDAGKWTATEWTSDIDTDAGSIDMPASFGEDARGDLYLVDLDGEVFRLDPQATSSDVGDTIHARGGDDQVYAGSGDDKVFGQLGADTLYGMDGNDNLQGGAEADSLGGGSGNDTLIGGDGNDICEGGSGNDVLRGVAGNDTLIGGDGDDLLVGGLGNDELAGGLGADRFRFDTALNSATNVDNIIDFSVVDDRILLDNKVFTAFADNGKLSNEAFYIGETAHNDTDRIIYSSATGALFYDPDGMGGAAATQFAQLAPGLAMSSQDFLIV